MRIIPNELKFDDLTSVRTRLEIKSSQIIQAILQVEEKTNIRKIYLYGSWINPKIDQVIEKGWLWDSTRLYYREPRDIDILVITESNNDVLVECVAEAEYEKVLCDSYDIWNEKHKNNQFIHLFIVNKNTVEKSLKTQGDNLIKRIYKNPIKLLWKNNQYED